MESKETQTSVAEAGDVTKNGKATTGFVLGMVGILAWFIPLFGYPVTITGIVMSVIGLKSQKRSLAMAGLILSIIFLVITLINSIAGIIIALRPPVA